jgi:hypothetical protein
MAAAPAARCWSRTRARACSRHRVLTVVPSPISVCTSKGLRAPGRSVPAWCGRLPSGSESEPVELADRGDRSAGPAVFAGGCTLEAAEEISEADLDMLASLVDESLLRQRDDRFLMLETLREYAMEWLVELEGGAEICRRYADYFRAFVLRGREKLARRRTGTADRPTIDVDAFVVMT